MCAVTRVVRRADRLVEAGRAETLGFKGKAYTTKRAEGKAWVKTKADARKGGPRACVEGKEEGLKG